MLDKRFFVPKTGHQRQVDILCNPRFTPSLQGHSTDKTISPVICFAEILYLKRYLK